LYLRGLDLRYGGLTLTHSCVAGLSDSLRDGLHSFDVCAYPMAARVHVHGLSLRLEGDSVLVSVGRKQVWDGTDLSLFRDTVHRLIRDGRRAIGVDLSGVQVLPSGFFGSLMEWSDEGVSISLRTPHARVQQLLWFREFFDQDHVDDEDYVDRFSLRPEKCTLRSVGRSLGRTQRHDLLGEHMILDRLPATYTSSAFNCLNSDVAKVTEYVLELERLTTSIIRLRQDVNSLRDAPPVRHSEVLDALVASVGGGVDYTAQQRQDALRPIVQEFFESMRHAHAARRFKQESCTRALVSLYTATAVEVLRKDFTSLEITDESTEHRYKLREAETQLKKLEQHLADRSASCLSVCFRDSCLPQEYRGNTRPSMLTHFQLCQDATDIDIGYCILVQFATDWRNVASAVTTPVTVHGVAINCMSQERKAAWQKAYLAMDLKPGDPTTMKVFAPRMEHREPPSRNPDKKVSKGVVSPTATRCPLASTMPPASGVVSDRP